MKLYQQRPRGSALAGIALAIAATLAAFGAAQAAEWQPTRPVTFVIPAGTGGGADQMARFIQGTVAKHNLMNQPMVVVNKAGGAGLEGFLDMKSTPRDPQKIVITLSNLFTSPLATGTPFNWKDLTPVAMLALDQFVLWVNADSPYKTAQEYIEAIKKGADHQFKMGGTGSKQEDQIITVALERAAGKKLTYVPFAGGGAVAVQLVGSHVDSTVNNPIEAVAHWKSGSLRPLCIFSDKRSSYTEKVTQTMAWSDIPTCKEAGLDVEYQMLRGIFMPSGATPDQVAYYVGLLQRVMDTPEWKQFMEQGAFNQTTMIGDEYRRWLESAEKLHRELMQEAGFLAKG
jgi:putative tricarboxylic transport membrane protein